MQIAVVDDNVCFAGTFIKLGNDFLYQVLFSNFMIIFMALLVAAGGKLLYEYRFFDAVGLIVLGFILLALIDFFVQTCVCAILEEQGMYF